MSGYTNTRIDGIGAEGGQTEFLQKPFAPVVLARKVRQVLKPANGDKPRGAGG